MRAIFDTNIIIDYLNGIQAAKNELKLYKIKSISIITYIEVLVGVSDFEEKAKVKFFLESFNIIAIDKNIAEIAILIRKKHKLKIPDSLILATAESIGGILITRDKQVFSKSIPEIRFPY